MPHKPWLVLHVQLFIEKNPDKIDAPELRLPVDLPLNSIVRYPALAVDKRDLQLYRFPLSYRCGRIETYPGKRNIRDCCSGGSPFSPDPDFCDANELITMPLPFRWGYFLFIVHEFASEDAIIKIGMAIDSTLGDEIKVTVVATGMGAPPLPVKAQVKVMQKPVMSNPNYDELDKPAIQRHGGKHENRETRFGAQAKKDIDLDYLDIPAFLRRQAD